MIAAAAFLVTVAVICGATFLAAAPPIVTDRLPAVARVRRRILENSSPMTLELLSTLTRPGAMKPTPAAGKRKGSPRWQGIRAGKPIIVNCHNHDAIGLCDPCLNDLRAILADVPRLLDDLDIAMAGEARFVEHGQRASDAPNSAGGGNPATAAYQRLSGALRAAQGWFDARHPEQLARLLHACLDQLQHEPKIGDIARDVSSAASRAHRTIERPPDLWFYGACPDCGRDIWLERVDLDDPGETVSCPTPNCPYAEPVQDHIRRQLDDNREMTVTELLAALTVAGEPVTRKQLEGWIRHRGLPRRTDNRPLFVDGELRPQDVYVYRLGDARALALEAEIRRTRRAVS